MSSKWKLRQIEPQPARGVLREEMWDSPDWIAEEKYDGDRRIAQFCGKVVRFTGRRKSVKDGLFVEKTENVPHLSGASSYARVLARLPKASVPAALEGTVLDGEMVINTENIPALHVDEGRSKYVTSIMGSLPEEAIRKQIERGWLQYVVFDCLFYKGEDIRLFTLARRRQMAITAVEDWGNPFVSFVESSGYGRASGAENKREICDNIVARGGEGVILKHVDHRYGDKNLWVKVKKQATADVVIMGFVPAKEVSKKVSGEVSMTKYAKAGLIGAIQCGQYVDYKIAGNGKVKLKSVQNDGLVEFATVSGMTDDMRAMLSNPKVGKTWIGKVIEIEHNGREPTGRFRHPRFSRFRDDKSAKDCVYREEES